MSTRLSSQEDYKKLLDSYDTWLFDCDGVLWRGDHLIDGVIEVLDILRRRSTSTPESNSSLEIYYHLSDKIRRWYLLPTTLRNRGRVTRRNLTN